MRLFPLAICGAAVLAMTAAGTRASGAASLTRAYSVQISGTVTGSRASQSGEQYGTITETASWTTTYPNVRIRLTPLAGNRRIPPSYYLAARGLGTTQIQTRYQDPGPLTRCDWSASFTVDTLFQVLGTPRNYYELRFGDRVRSFDTPLPSARDGGCSDNASTAATQGATWGTPNGGRSVTMGMSRFAIEVYYLWLKPQPRVGAAFPLNRLFAGRAFTLSADAQNETSNGPGHIPDRGSGHVTIVFTPRP